MRGRLTVGVLLVFLGSVILALTLALPSYALTELSEAEMAAIKAGWCQCVTSGVCGVSGCNCGGKKKCNVIGAMSGCTCPDTLYQCPIHWSWSRCIIYCGAKCHCVSSTSCNVGGCGCGGAVTCTINICGKLGCHCSLQKCPYYPSGTCNGGCNVVLDCSLADSYCNSEGYGCRWGCTCRGSCTNQTHVCGCGGSVL